jgi:mannobiose 2-epimerase
VENVGRQLTELIRIHLDHILDRETSHLSLYFDEEWRSLSKTVSFGHDIEASWLLCEAADELGDPDLSIEVEAAAVQMVDRTIEEGMESSGAVWNERFGDGRIDTHRHWWPQVEAIVGLVNAHQITGREFYSERALRCWEYCRSHLIDRKRGEWRWGVTANGIPMEGEDKVGPWKGPYHHSRMCLEIMRRVESLNDSSR